MPESKDVAASKQDAGQAEVQKKVDEATKQGFYGIEVDPIPNSAYSLQSGPDSPTIAEQEKALKEKDK